MKHESRTIGQSRTWAHDLCARLDRSSRPFQFWDLAVADSEGRPFWQVYRRWGCSRASLRARRQQALDLLMEADITQVHGHL